MGAIIIAIQNRLHGRFSLSTNFYMDKCHIANLTLEIKIVLNRLINHQSNLQVPQLEPDFHTD